MIGGRKEIMDRWKEHFSELLSIQTTNILQHETMHVYISEPKITDAHEVISKMKDNRVPREYGISAELIKKKEAGPYGRVFMSSL